MRTFLSHGPIDLNRHFGVPRTELVQQCLHHLVGDSIENGGHYFTIWSSRQTGKTWLMQQVIHEVSRQYGDQFAVCPLSFEFYDEFFDPAQEPDRLHIPEPLVNLLTARIPGKRKITNWNDFLTLFTKDAQVWDRPVLVLIDEVDSLPSAILDRLVKQFRGMYLNRDYHWLHGLALIGVRAVVGVNSPRGSPFNIQRSLHIPNLTPDEVRDMYQQYHTDSGQTIDPAVVEDIYAVTRGQPGLVSWFGELLAIRYNPGHSHPITMPVWHRAYRLSANVSINNTIINLIAKARSDYHHYVIKLFTNPNIEFSFDADWCNFMYMHGIIDYEEHETPDGEYTTLCRFASPYIQLRLYKALARNWFAEESSPSLPEDSDTLTNVFVGNTVQILPLLAHYQRYINQLDADGKDPWRDQPRRATDLRLTEAVGHFHLYAWLTHVLPNCTISPEFPTGNGTVDLHLRFGEQREIIEIKSFVNRYVFEQSRQQAARYAKQVEVDHVTLVVFFEGRDETVLARLSGTETIDGIAVATVVIGWGRGNK